MGKNQMIAAAVFGTLIVGSIALVALERVTGAEWLAWSQWFGPTAVATVTGPSAVIKTAIALRAK